MKFVLNQFIRLVLFLSITPTHLPKRIDKITDILSDETQSGVIYVDIDSFKLEEEVNINKLSLKELKLIVKILQDRVDRGEFKINKEGETHYLLTRTRICCGVTLKAKWTDGCNATLYTNTGPISAISFTFTCQICKKRFLPSYTETTDSSGTTQRAYIKLPQQDDGKMTAFHITKETYFTYDFLKCLTFDIVISHTEFANYCTAYNAKFCDDAGMQLNARRLIDVYLVYHLAKRVDLCFTVPRDSWRAINTELICNDFYTLLKESIDYRWLSHTCNSPGCLRRLVIGDGDQKLFRTRCKAMGEQVILERGELNPVRACPEDPLPGEPFCKAHLNGQAAKAPVEQADIRRTTRQTSRQLGIEIEELSTSENDQGEGCRTKENITTNKNNREVTCGQLYFFRDCFIRLGHVEMLIAESCTLIVLALIDLFGKYPLSTLIRGLAFDRACEISPFMRNKGLDGNLVMMYWNLRLSMVVDKFHIGGHKRPECKLEDPRCKYHPDHSKNKDLWGNVNSEVAEQSFRVLNKSKNTTRYMSRARRLVFLKVLDDEVNMIQEKRQMKEGTLIKSGSDISYEESRKNSVDKTSPPEEFLQQYGGQSGINQEGQAAMDHDGPNEELINQSEGYLAGVRDNAGRDVEFLPAPTEEQWDENSLLSSTRNMSNMGGNSSMMASMPSSRSTGLPASPPSDLPVLRGGMSRVTRSGRPGPLLDVKLTRGLQESSSSNLTCDLCGVVSDSQQLFLGHLETHLEFPPDLPILRVAMSPVTGSRRPDLSQGLLESRSMLQPSQTLSRSGLPGTPPPVELSHQGLEDAMDEFDSTDQESIGQREGYVAGLRNTPGRDEEFLSALTEEQWDENSMVSSMPCMSNMDVSLADRVHSTESTGAPASSPSRGLLEPRSILQHPQTLSGSVLPGPSWDVQLTHQGIEESSASTLTCALCGVVSDSEQMCLEHLETHFNV